MDDLDNRVDQAVSRRVSSWFARLSLGVKALAIGIPIILGAAGAAWAVSPTARIDVIERVQALQADRLTDLEKLEPLITADRKKAQEFREEFLEIRGQLKEIIRRLPAPKAE